MKSKKSKLVKIKESLNNFMLDLDEIKKSLFYQKYEDLCKLNNDNLDNNFQLVYNQLKVRDNIIDQINMIFHKFWSYCISFTSDLQAKIKNLKLKNKKLKKRKNHLKKNLKVIKVIKNVETNNLSVNEQSKDDANSYQNESSVDEFDKMLDIKDTNITSQNYGEELPANEVSEEKWNTDDIAEEVKSIANDVVKNSGYSYLEDLQMYYDNESGYYYDPKTSLYYDDKSGTYFYYDHESESYQFYSYAEGRNQIVTDAKSPTTEKESDDLDSCIEIKYSENSNISECDTEHVDQIFEKADYCSEPDVAPCLRLMVTNGDEIGSLHVVTLTGGIIGKDINNTVVLNDPSVSKLHAEISYTNGGPFDHHYFLRDVGSNNGTFVRNVRLSDSRCKSDPVELGHGWTMKIGAVQITCHIHPGYLTCNTCEPGLLPLKEKKKSNENTDKEQVRRRVNKRLKKKYVLQENRIQSSGYKNRAIERRKTVGSDNPYEKTDVASIDECISNTNKGYKLMEKMGWSQGHGLGASEDGIVQPVLPLAPSFDHVGLGASPFSAGRVIKKSCSSTGDSTSKVSSIKFQPSSTNDT